MMSFNVFSRMKCCQRTAFTPFPVNESLLCRFDLYLDEYLYVPIKVYVHQNDGAEGTDGQGHSACKNPEHTKATSKHIEPTNMGTYTHKKRFH